jgi:hypothetical protein
MFWCDKDVYAMPIVVQVMSVLSSDNDWSHYYCIESDNHCLEDFEAYQEWINHLDARKVSKNILVLP